nr:cytochrome P450 [Paris polyphylla]
MGWPIIGEGLSPLKEEPNHILGEYLETHISRYGKLFTTNIFGWLAIVSVDVELKRFMLQNEMKLFTHAWPRHFKVLIGESATMFLTGDAHKHSRSNFIKFFAGAKLHSPILSQVEQLATMAMSSWENNSIILAKNEILKFAFNTIAKASMGMRAEDPKTEKLRQQFDVFVGGMFAVIPFKFPGNAYWKALKSKDYITEALGKVVEERIQMSAAVGVDENLEEEDLLTCLLNDTRYTKEQVIQNLQFAILGNYLTTPKTMATLIHQLGKCPKAVEQLREEQLEAIRNKEKQGDSKLTWSDYKNMEFTQCVINEALRVASAGVIPKKAIADVKYKGYIIPQGCLILSHNAAMSHDPDLYHDPKHFNPWRWIGDESGADKPKATFFGGGPRQCPGSEFARLEMTVFLHHLIAKYNWKPVSPNYNITIANVDSPKGLPIKIEALV